MQNEQCKICRRVGQKLFLKGDRCYSPKCAMLRRATPPGPERKKKSWNVSEYKKALTEKQKLRNWYGLAEFQFKRYVEGVLVNRAKIQDIGDELIKRLEKRLDSVVFSMGFAKSRVQARQLVNHGHFTINGKSIDIPSYIVKKDDVVALKETKKKKPEYIGLLAQLNKKTFPAWVEVDKKNFTGKLKQEPRLVDTQPAAELSVIFEFYSK